ncbi:Rha family transcriptional regulator [Hymenobacter sp. PAMC 26628]|uniref:Rha family transcriptional regulator n=1 Tax=Hymenobacter sp. PAMC 26628 TaxID=1484118 RepID=UPI0009E8748B|nr:Rha family transcriptional regulator [Hymenobacter sp. PAMC 26628]
MNADDRNALECFGVHDKVNENSGVYLSKKGTPITSTLPMSKDLDMTHGNLLQTLDNLDVSPEFDRMNYHSITYRDSRNRQQREVVMTRQGCVRLLLAFRGKRAAAFLEQYIAQFDRMEARLRASQSAAPAATPLVALTRTDVQVTHVKAANAYLWRLANDPHVLIQHHRQVMWLLTTRTPSQYRRDAVENGMRVSSLSGRQVLRQLEPAKACTAALMDELVEQGCTLEQIAAAGIPQTLTAAFDAMLRCGIAPAELRAAA